MKCGDKVVDVRDNGEKLVRIFLGTFNGRHILVHGGEEEHFYAENGAPIVYWSDNVEPIRIVDVGLTVQDRITINSTVERRSVAEEMYYDHDGFPVVLRFMTKDEAEQRRK